MNLSNDLISQFVKATANTKKVKTESVVYGTAVEYGDSMFVKLDGSDLLTPISTTTAVKDGERVTIRIKDHTATVTGNLSSPSGRDKDVQYNSGKIAYFDEISAYKVTTDELEAINATIDNLQAKVAEIESLEAVNAEIENLKAKFAEFDTVTAEDAEILNAEIENLEATIGTFEDLSAEELEAINADIGNLKGYVANFTYVSADVLTAMKGEIKELDVEKLDAKEAEIKYANIDFANIGEAAIKKFYAVSGLIQDIYVDNATIAGYLVGVTVKGDLIEGNTIKADKLVVKGEDGLYYKLNFEAGEFTGGEEVPTDSLHGSVITAKSITAEKVTISDLVAFDATIGGFEIDEHSIHSWVKDDAGNTTRGIYLDSDGQVNFGDSNNYLKYFQDVDGQWKLAISANGITLAATGTTVEEELERIKDLEVGARNILRNSTTLLFEDYIFRTITDDDEPVVFDVDSLNYGHVPVTQAEYDALVAADALEDNVIYLIKGDT